MCSSSGQQFVFGQAGACGQNYLVPIAAKAPHQLRPTGGPSMQGSCGVPLWGQFFDEGCRLEVSFRECVLSSRKRAACRLGVVCLNGRGSSGQQSADISSTLIVTSLINVNVPNLLLSIYV